MCVKMYCIYLNTKHVVKKITTFNQLINNQP